MKQLIGHTIREIWIDIEEQHYLQFKTKENLTFTYIAVGDCL